MTTDQQQLLKEARDRAYKIYMALSTEDHNYKGDARRLLLLIDMIEKGW